MLFVVLVGSLSASAEIADRSATEVLLAEFPFDPSTPPQRIVIDLAPPNHRRRLPLQLDTGATASVLTPRIARELGVKVNALRVDPYRRMTALGRDLLFYVDTRRSDTASSTFEYGLLGGEFMADYVVELDFAGRFVRFYDPEGFEVPAVSSAADEVILPLEIVSNRPAIRASINGQPLLLLIDTGAPMGLMLSGEYAREAGVASAPLEGFQMTGAKGPVESELGVANEVAIGPFRFSEVAVAVAPNGFFNLGFPGDSIIGFDLLAQFRVRIDYPRRRVALRRNPDVQFAYDPHKPQTITAAIWPIPPEPPDALTALAPRSEAEPEQVWLEWGAPNEAERVSGPLGWVEVSGWAGVGDPIEHDVVIAIDVSGSTAYASGEDIDGDGQLGRARRQVDQWRTFNPRHLSSDPGDTILAAELIATRRLIELLDPDRTRIGLVAFSSGANILAPLGSDRARIGLALEDLEAAFGSGSTNLAQAIERGAEALHSGASEPDRRRTLLVLSDGYPTAPGSPQRAAREALVAAEAARGSDIRIDAFGLGLGEIEEGDVYVEVASMTGGRYIRLDAPAQIIHELPKIDLANVAQVEIENATSGTQGRAVRVNPDGSFDGFLMLEPGENIVYVSALGHQGGTRREQRNVFFDAEAVLNAEAAQRYEQRLDALRDALERRRIETELLAEIQAARKLQAQRQLTLEVDGDEPPP